MNYKLNFGVLFCALTTALFGCTEKSDDSVDPADKKHRITVTMPSESTGVVTRAAAAAAEVAVKSSFVIVYDKDAAETAMPKFTAKLASEDVTAGSSANIKVLSFFNNHSIVAGDVVYVVFNKELANLQIAQNKLVEAIKLTSAGVGTGIFSTGLVNLSKGLPMYGKGQWVDGTSTTISVRRAVAKVQLKLVYSTGVEHVAGTIGVGYTTANTTFKLYQLSDIGYVDGSVATSTGIAPITSIANGNEINHPSAKIDDNFTGANYIFAYSYASKSVGRTPIEFTDNKPKTERLAMIMKNVYNGKTTYHRLDICDPSSKTYFDILNNHHYTVKVREVSVGGYSTATDALKNPPSNIRYDIIVEEEGDVVVTNGQYLLNVNTKGDKFDVTAASSTLLLSKVNRIDSEQAPIIGESVFSGILEEHFRIGTATQNATIKPLFPTTVGNSAKDLKVTATGSGVVAFRYIATLGNIVYESNTVTVSTNFSDAVAIKSYGEIKTYTVSSLSNDWSVVSDSPWAVVSKAAGNRSFTLDVKANDMSNTNSRSAKITISNNIDVAVVVNITQRNFPFFADRNVGVDTTLTGDAALSNAANSRTHYFLWSESIGVCEKWTFQGKKWRQPDKDDFDALVASGKLKKSGPGSHDAFKMTQSDGKTIFFAASGYNMDRGCSACTFERKCRFWSSEKYYCLYYNDDNTTCAVTNTYAVWKFGVRCCRVF